jgi:predicted amidohydrolase YtcJ
MTPCRFICFLLAWSAGVWAADADLILHNGKIVTVDAAFSVRQAVAIKDGKITAVGANATVLTERGPQTRVIDLRGATVLPGLIDSHVHALEAGLSEFRGPLPPLDSFAAVQSYLRTQAQRIPKGEWIIVPRTFPTRLREMQMPTREVLDVVPEHPVMFDASYVVIANSLALKISGITRDTPNPPGGEIVKDKNGEPNGILKNAQGMLKMGPRPSTRFTEEERLKALEDQLKRYLAAGLTSVNDRAVDAEQIALYQKLKQQNRLPIRVALTWRPSAAPPAENLIATINSQPFTTGTGDEWLKFGAFKLTLDGGMTIGTAFQRHPYGPFGKQLYGKTDPDDRGQLFIQPEKLLTVMRAARARGWQLTTHDQGGGAVDAWLDALTALDREKPIRDTRSFVMHASFQSPDAIARMKKMSILADTQSQWLYYDGPALEKVFGSGGMRYFFPLRSYVDAGIIVAAGSDHMIGHDMNQAVNPYNPFLSMWIEIARKTTAGNVLVPQERITRAEALKTHTVWAAYMQFSEKLKGSVEAGKMADLVVIDADFLTCPEDQIKNIRAVTTILDGRIVYERARSGSPQR